MARHLVLGAGGIGRHTALELARLGHAVTLASRSGHVTDRPWEAAHPGAVEVVAVDASDSARVTELATGAASIVNAVNPPSYTTWDRDWPPVATALRTAAARTGAGLVVIGNLYAYGRVEGPMRESQPLAPNGHKGRLRADMWTDLLADHESGRLRATELRSSDYFGPGATRMTSYLNDVVARSLLSGRTPFMPVGRTDAPHSWTYIPDVGRLAATLATDDRSWGRAWHTPSGPAHTIQGAADDIARLAGVRPRRVRALPGRLVTAAGVVVPFMRELRETRHQFEGPFLLDASETEATFGVGATPWEEALTQTIDALRAASVRAAA